MENSGRLFEGDVVAPDQYMAIFSRSNNLEPEQELMLAILADAIECILKYCDEPVPMRLKLFNEAEEWVFAEDDRDPFSFLNVCEILKFDPSYLRSGLQAKMRSKVQQEKQTANPLVKKFRAHARLRSSTAARSRAGL